MRTLVGHSTQVALATVIAAISMVSCSAASSAQPLAFGQGALARSSLRVNVKANVNDAGTWVRMRARVTCPEGRRFRIRAELHQINSDAPYDDGGDLGVLAERPGPELTGTCTGDPQRLRWRMPGRGSGSCDVSGG